MNKVLSVASATPSTTSAKPSTINPIKIERILSASSHDTRHPPEHIMNQSNPKSFWISTGLYPQFISFELAREINVKKVMVISTGVQQFSVERCTDEKGFEFEAIGRASTASGSQEFDIQQTTITTTGTQKTKIVRLILSKGFADFSSIRKIVVSE